MIRPIFVYANGRTDLDEFDNKLEFETNLIAYTGNADWVEPVLFDIKECLEGNQIPESGEDCDYCTFWEARNSL